LLLRKLLFQFYSDQHFDHLPLERLFGSQKKRARKLHRDRRSALLVPLMRKVDPRRFGKA